MLAVSMTFIFSVANAENYGLCLDGVEVTSENASDPLGNGVFCYHPETKILDVNGIYHATTWAAIENVGVDGLIINIANQSELSASKWAVIYIEQNTTITGTDTLKVVGEDCYGIWVAETSVLTVDKAQMKVSGVYQGITGNRDAGFNSYEGIVICNSYLEVTAKEGSWDMYTSDDVWAMGYFLKEFILDNSSISFPDKAFIHEGTIFANDNNLADKVIITPNLSGTNHNYNKSEKFFYDLQGRKVTNPRKGEIYIQNGKKYINK